MAHLQPNLVEIFQGRWDVTIIVTDKDGEVHTYIASADSALTEGSEFGSVPKKSMMKL